ncbi:MAG: flagellar export chaperone FliS [Acidobacteriia bacterium]|nr:flagellar export chaperone FliS [Terriglobia bacterium]
MKGRAAYLETHVLSADPMELVCLLYQHGADAVQDARQYLASGDIAARAKAISKTIAILGELTASLNREVGGAIGSNLEQLYNYMTLRLTEANVRQQDGPLAEVQSLLTTLGQAWQETRARQSAVAVHPAVPAPDTPATPPAAAAWQETDLEPATHGWSA